MAFSSLFTTSAQTEALTTVKPFFHLLFSFFLYAVMKLMSFLKRFFILVIFFICLHQSEASAAVASPCGTWNQGCQNVYTTWGRPWGSQQQMIMPYYPYPNLYPHYYWGMSPFYFRPMGPSPYRPYNPYDCPYCGNPGLPQQWQNQWQNNMPMS